MSSPLYKIRTEQVLLSSGNGALFGMGLTSASGETHRKQRKMLSPAFSPNHLRQLAPVFLDVAERVRTFPSFLFIVPQRLTSACKALRCNHHRSKG